MLVEMETGLVDLIKASALGKRVRQVDSLPDLDGDSLVGRFIADAPAVYVAMGSFPVKSGYARPKYGIACVAKNSRGQREARHGDGITIGLQQMLDAAMALLDGATLTVDDDTVAFEVTSCDLVTSEALFQKGVYAGVVHIQTIKEIPLPSILDESALAAFEVFHADYDIEPHETASEHDKWLQEPADHGSSAPDLSDNLSLNQE